MPLETGLELSILDSAASNSVIVYARCGSDIAVSRLTLDGAWQRLQGFRDTLDKGLRGKGTKPNPADIDRFGHDLFSFVMQGDVGRLYSAANKNAGRSVSLNLFSNRSELQDLPWEYLQEPDSPGGPGERAVVRLLPTIGLSPSNPVPIAAGARILFVAADPVTQLGVPWTDVEATLRRHYTAKVPKTAQITIVEGATQADLSKALRAGPYDVFHFTGHGEVRGGVGGLLLTGNPPFLPADRLAALFRGTKVRLAVLSACETAAGNRTEPFSIVADALIRVGISAVVANQLPVPSQTVAIFVGALYEELLQSGDIDRAVTMGRRALAYEDSSGRPVGIEWGVPTLHRLVGGSQVYTP